MNTPAASRSTPSPEIVLLSPASFADDAAAQLLARHRAALPDLSDLRIVAPPRAGAGLKAALTRLASQYGHGALFLPVIDTFAGHAARVVLRESAPEASNAERVLTVFNALKRQKWFSPAEALRVARELVRLVDGLTHAMAAMPADADEHARLLARAYAIARRNEDFGFEARLTFDIWRALSQGEALDPAAHYALRLSTWAANAGAPLYIFDSADFTRREQTFLREYAQRNPVVMFQRRFHEHSPRGIFLSRALADAPGLPTVENDDGSKASIDGLRAVMARDVEQEAWSVLATLKSWLKEGRQQIAVVALDRQAARRLRAIAERDGILMQDEVGWPYSTTLSGTAIMRWLEAKQDGFYYATVIDLIKSPFLFEDWRETWGRDRLKSAVLAIERAIKREGVVSGLDRMRDAVRATLEEPHDALALLDRLIAANAAFPTSRRAASAWLTALRDSLETLGIAPALARDVAGRGLLDALDALASDIAHVDIALAAGEWVDWLRGQLEEIRFRDPTISSPIVLTSLEATRFRRFDAAWVMGASMPHLPGAADSSGLFNDAVRRSLGLRGHADELASISRDLMSLMLAVPVCCLSWQSDDTREPVPPAPWLHALILEAHRMGAELRSVAQGQTPALARLSRQKWLESRANAGVPCLRAPAPVISSAQLPTRITASQYQSLVDCPYQYFARAVLGLREGDDVREEMEKRDFGEYVHAILNRFHRRFPVVGAVPREALRAAIEDDTSAEFAQAIEQNFTAHAWRLSWTTAIDTYLDWQISREASGWRWSEGESTRALPIVFDDGGQLQLEGRLDRLDQRESGEKGVELAVIDYKTVAVQTLRDKLKRPGEDVQLPVYAALAGVSGAPVGEASYLAIARDAVDPVECPEPADAAGEAVVRLVDMFKALRAGAPLRAQGTDPVCEHCEMRGLCRRDHWSES